MAAKYSSCRKNLRLSTKIWLWIRNNTRQTHTYNGSFIKTKFYVPFDTNREFFPAQYSQY